MNDKPDLNLGIYRVSFYERRFRNGNSYLLAAEGDLIFLEGIPWLVMEWANDQNGLYPRVKVQLDPSQIEPSIPPEQVQIYRVPIEDPRTIH